MNSRETGVEAAGSGSPHMDRPLRDAFEPTSGTAEQWNEAYARLSDYFRAHRIHSRLHRTSLVLETLRHAARTHAYHPEFTPTQCAIHEARRSQKQWLRGIVGDLRLPEDRLESNGRVAFLMCNGPRLWPDYFLKKEAVPPEMMDAMRRRVEQSGPDLAISSMVPREIELGFIPEIADDTFEMFEKYPVLRLMLVVFALALAVLAGLHIGSRTHGGGPAPERSRHESRERPPDDAAAPEAAPQERGPEPEGGLTP